MPKSTFASLFVALLVFLGGCGTGLQRENRPPLEPASGSFKAGLAMKVDSGFSESKLRAFDREAAAWYEKMWRSPAFRINVVRDARAGTSRAMARTVNLSVTAMLATLRVTGDARLLDKVAEIMSVARSKLRRGPDGYLSWRGDRGELEEVLAHGMVAQVAYAFHLNRAVKKEYAEQARFWRDYLENHYEKKWRKRVGNRYGSAVVDKFLMHAYLESTRYHLYMYKLTGKKTYLNTALKKAAVVQRAFKVYRGAFVWPHSVNEPRQLLGWGAGWNYQANVYVGETTSSVYDMALEDFGPFSTPSFMRTFSNAIKNLMDTKDRVRSTRSYVLTGDIGPARCAAGRTLCLSAKKTFPDPFFKRVTYLPSRYEKGRLFLVLVRPYAMAGVWDGSGTILSKAKRYYAFNTNTFMVPAAVVVSKLTR